MTGFGGDVFDFAVGGFQPGDFAGDEFTSVFENGIAKRFNEIAR